MWLWDNGLKSVCWWKYGLYNLIFVIKPWQQRLIADLKKPYNHTKKGTEIQIHRLPDLLLSHGIFLFHSVTRR